eukprot:jgi/Mesvir1/2204/Mv09849-RA.1
MSGTSADGLDLALLEFGPQLSDWTILAWEEQPFPAALRERILRAPTASTPEVSSLSATYIRHVASCVKSFLEGKPEPDLIVSHGQTVFHAPGAFASSNEGTGHTLQLGDGNMLSVLVGVPVLWNLRSGDVALGGQGAPLVPVADQLLFGARGPAAVLSCATPCCPARSPPPRRDPLGDGCVDTASARPQARPRVCTASATGNSPAATDGGDTPDDEDRREHASAAATAVTSWVGGAGNPHDEPGQGRAPPRGSAASDQGTLCPTPRAACSSLLSWRPPRFLLNIGGIANITVLHPLPCVQMGFDVGPGNCLLDSWVALRTQGRLQCDAGGSISKQGTVHRDSLHRLLGVGQVADKGNAGNANGVVSSDACAPSEFCCRPATWGQSLARERLNVERFAAFPPHLSLEDGAATLVELSAALIAEAAQHALMSALQHMGCGRTCTLSKHDGVAAQAGSALSLDGAEVMGRSGAAGEVLNGLAVAREAFVSSIPAGQKRRRPVCSCACTGMQLDLPLFVAGGGALNPTLMASIQRCLPTSITLPAQEGVRSNTSTTAAWTTFADGDMPAGRASASVQEASCACVVGPAGALSSGCQSEACPLQNTGRVSLTCRWRVGSSVELGVPEQCREAACFAALGWLYLREKPGTSPLVTGASRAIRVGSLALPD